MASLRIVVLGSGNAFNTDGRASPALWLEPYAGAPLIVDIGPTALASMERLRLKPGAIDRVLFTHLHGDHVAGWPFLLLHNAFVARRTKVLSVHGPTGTEEQLMTLCRGAYPELLSSSRLRFPLEYHEIPVARATDIDAGAGVRFDVIPLEHHPTSIGYRIHVAGVTVGVTGDTRWCAGLEELSQGCDVLVVECSSVEKQEYAHVSLEEVRERIRRLGSARTVLVHVTDAVVRALREHPVPGVVAAEDGLSLDL